MARVLVVDDEPQLCAILCRLLDADGHRATIADSAPAARAMLTAQPFELVLCDIHMPGESGLELVQQLLAERSDVAVVMVSGADDPALAEAALDHGAFGYVVKPFRNTDITIAVANALRRRRLELENRSHRERLEQLVSQRTAALQRSREETINRLARAAESRDSDTGRHIERVSRLSFLLAEQLGVDSAEAELIRIASPLHDLGKIAISDGILFKNGPLTPQERAEMERHAEHGREMLAGADEPLMDLAAEVAWTHHERFDGSGYPRGLIGDEIPIAGRIVAVADVFDALMSRRVYRPAMPLDQTLRLMRLGRGTQFDPDVLDLLLNHLDAALAIRERLEDALPPSVPV